MSTLRIIAESKFRILYLTLPRVLTRVNQNKEIMAMSGIVRDEEGKRQAPLLVRSILYLWTSFFLSKLINSIFLHNRIIEWLLCFTINYQLSIWCALSDLLCLEPWHGKNKAYLSLSGIKHLIWFWNVSRLSALEVVRAIL